MIGAADEHPPSRHCDCPECINYFTEAGANARLRAFVEKTAPINPKLRKALAEDRPHLRDAAFLHFMGKVVGDSLRNL